MFLREGWFQDRVLNHLVLVFLCRPDIRHATVIVRRQLAVGYLRIWLALDGQFRFVQLRLHVLQVVLRSEMFVM